MSAEEIPHQSQEHEAKPPTLEIPSEQWKEYHEGLLFVLPLAVREQAVGSALQVYKANALERLRGLATTLQQSLEQQGEVPPLRLYQKVECGLTSLIRPDEWKEFETGRYRMPSNRLTFKLI
jgi:hypothetical protein